MNTPASAGPSTIQQGTLGSGDQAVDSSRATTGTGKPPLAKNTFYIKTFGCQMNVADSERMASLLADKGMRPAATVEEAGLILINGCTVREKAVHKAVSTLGKFHHDLKAQGIEKPMIGIGGCVGQLEKKELFKRAPYLDFVFGTDTIDHLPEIVHRVEHGEKHVVFADFEDRARNYSTETKVFGAKAQAFVNVMKGCDKFCTYCVVPFTRGREKSRTIDEVLADLARLVATGVREVTLLGQNVNSFGKGNKARGSEGGPAGEAREPRELRNRIGKVGPREGDENFPQLLRAIETDPRLARLRRVRFTSSHPLDFSDELIECYSPVSLAEGGTGVAKLAPHLHLPVQSGSNRILGKMGRHHRIEDYFAQMARLREINPDVGLGTDLIVGFPGETEADFRETLRLLDVVQYDTVYAFAYSPRPGTRAAKLVDDVPDGVKNERLNRLLAHQLAIGEKRNAALVGRVMEVMIEGEGKNQKMVSRDTRENAPKGHVWTGRTGCNRIVNVADGSGRRLTGQFLKVRINDATQLSLRGELIHDARHAETSGLDADAVPGLQAAEPSYNAAVTTAGVEIVG